MLLTALFGMVLQTDTGPYAALLRIPQVHKMGKWVVSTTLV
jgi:hypothetical protein